MPQPEGATTDHKSGPGSAGGRRFAASGRRSARDATQVKLLVAEEEPLTGIQLSAGFDLHLVKPVGLPEVEGVLAQARGASN